MGWVLKEQVAVFQADHLLLKLAPKMELQLCSLNKKDSRCLLLIPLANKWHLSYTIAIIYIIQFLLQKTRTMHTMQIVPVRWMKSHHNILATLARQLNCYRNNSTINLEISRVSFKKKKLLLQLLNSDQRLLIHPDSIPQLTENQSHRFNQHWPWKIWWKELNNNNNNSRITKILNSDLTLPKRNLHSSSSDIHNIKTLTPH